MVAQVRPQLITKQWNGKTLTFRDDGYFNMTKAAKQFGKRLDNFMKSPETKEYLEALSLKSRDKDLVVVQRGSCSGSIKPDTNVGGNIATISEVSDDQETTYFFA